MNTTEFDKVIFQFDAFEYTQEEVEKLTFEECEKLCNTDEMNVTKFDLNNISLQDFLNNDCPLNWADGIFRVFI